MLKLMEIRSKSRILQVGNRHTLITGVINVTPDSYVAGSRVAPQEASARARLLVLQGADIVEIGGESTGPDSMDISLEEELKRVIPAVSEIRKALPDIWISVDTYKAEVARQALESGADIINDITAGRADKNMFDVIAAAGCAVVLMYAKDPTPRTTRDDRQYRDVAAEVSGFLNSRIEEAVLRCIDRSRIIIDPGLGHFVSADPKYSFELLARLDILTSLAPVMVSPSRKSFLAGDENLPADRRLPATLAAAALAVSKGASLIRTHDVAQTRQACRVAEQIRIISGNE